MTVEATPDGPTWALTGRTLAVRQTRPDDPVRAADEPGWRYNPRPPSMLGEFTYAAASTIVDVHDGRR